MNYCHLQLHTGTKMAIDFISTPPPHYLTSCNNYVPLSSVPAEPTSQVSSMAI